MKAPRVGSTVVIVAGDRVGIIGRLGSVRRGRVSIESPFVPQRWVMADLGDIAAAPHPLSWYQRVQGRHQCAGCDALQERMFAR